MTENEILELILNRLGRSETAEAFFNADETEEWPSGMREALIKNRLFRKAQPVKALECKGCEENCFMQVHVLAAEGDRPVRAFIACDKRTDISRVPVELYRLDQWKITGSLLAKALSSLLEFEKSPQEENKGKRWVLGIVKGKKKRAQAALLFENGILLQLAGHEISAYEVLRLHEGVLTVDLQELIHRVDHPSEDFSYKPSIRRRESRKQQTQERNAIIRESYRQWKRDKPKKTDKWYSKKIAEELKEQGYNISAETVRRNLKR